MKTKFATASSAAIAAVAICLYASPLSAGEVLKVSILPGESWFGAVVSCGLDMPWTERTKGFSRDLRKGSYTNQTSPMLLSDKGRWIWCDDPFAFAVDGGEISVETSGTASIEMGTAKGGTLRAAYLFCMESHFRPEGKTPDPMLFSAPQYNTWIELNYHQNQKDLMSYAEGIRANGFPAGVLMIDDTWQTDYGVWTFDASAFPDPKGMMDALHKMGFKVSLWVCPFVSMDSRPYRAIAPKGAFLPGVDGSPEPVAWWNGKSAVLDLTSPVAVGWLRGELDRLVRDFGVDGFKFDAADVHFYTGSRMRLPAGTVPVDQCAAYAAFGKWYPLNEYRACWKNGGRALAQRLNDKSCTWRDLSQLIPDMAAAGLLGHLFVCPDMIGGGLLGSFKPGVPVDQELFVRSAQVHALSPMMQFSVAPWRVLDKEHLALVKAAVDLRQKFATRFLALADECAKSGEPMLRSMEYAFPGNGYSAIKDQFAMGDFLIVAPQIEKGAESREVRLPAGRWLADDGEIFTGPARITVKTPLSRLPHFVADVSNPIPAQGMTQAWRPSVRWRGFNLLGMFCQTKMGTGDKRIFGYFPEDRFQWMQEWGFNFARLPLDYRFFVEKDDWMKPVESQLEKLDEAVRYGKKHGIHIQINFHRAPGYCCNPPQEQKSLFRDPEPLAAFTNLWSVLAKRYRGIPNKDLSFDLVNEPAPVAFYGATPSNYAVVARAAFAAIRAVDPDRFVMSDGWRWGKEPVKELRPFDPASGESIHSYEPQSLTHYRVFDKNDQKPCPPWPPKGCADGVEWLERNYVDAWRSAIDDGTFLFVGELGCCQHTGVPHATYLAWLEDTLKVCERHGWGWALWNLDGMFGILDTSRTDCELEDFHGHKLDRKALELLKRY